MCKAGNSPALVTAIALLAGVYCAGPNPARADGSSPAELQTKQAVARALNLDLSDSDNQLEVLRVPLPGAARIRVVSVKPTPGQRSVLVRLSCERASDCLPFYAVVRGERLPSLLQRGSVAPARSARPATTPLHSGDRVEVVEELSGLRLHTRGVCLQAGSVGDRIRVRTVTNHRVLLATIATPSLVKVDR